MRFMRIMIGLDSEEPWTKEQELRGKLADGMKKAA